ncbi:PIN domain-containing protein [bacterium]|nr:MAG: PIN domain-containing protein [bacterium]
MRRYIICGKERAWRPLNRHESPGYANDVSADHPRLGAGDAIIAATAISNQASLLSLDKDFHSLTRIGLRLF